MIIAMTNNGVTLYKMSESQYLEKVGTPNLNEYFVAYIPKLNYSPEELEVQLGNLSDSITYYYYDDGEKMVRKEISNILEIDYYRDSLGRMWPSEQYYQFIEKKVEIDPIMVDLIAQDAELDKCDHINQLLGLKERMEFIRYYESFFINTGSNYRINGIHGKKYQVNIYGKLIVPDKLKEFTCNNLVGAVYIIAIPVGLDDNNEIKFVIHSFEIEKRHSNKLYLEFRRRLNKDNTNRNSITRQQANLYYEGIVRDFAREQIAMTISDESITWLEYQKYFFDRYGFELSQFSKNWSVLDCLTIDARLVQEDRKIVPLSTEYLNQKMKDRSDGAETTVIGVKKNRFDRMSFEEFMNPEFHIDAVVEQTESSSSVADEVLEILEPNVEMPLFSNDSKEGDALISAYEQRENQSYMGLDDLLKTELQVQPTMEEQPVVGVPESTTTIDTTNMSEFLDSDDESLQLGETQGNKGVPVTDSIEPEEIQEAVEELESGIHRFKPMSLDDLLKPQQEISVSQDQPVVGALESPISMDTTNMSEFLDSDDESLQLGETQGNEGVPVTDFIEPEEVQEAVEELESGIHRFKPMSLDDLLKPQQEISISQDQPIVGVPKSTTAIDSYATNMSDFLDGDEDTITIKEEQSVIGEVESIIDPEPYATDMSGFLDGDEDNVALGESQSIVGEAESTIEIESYVTNMSDFLDGDDDTVTLEQLVVSKKR